MTIERQLQNAKRLGYDSITIDTDALQQRVLSNLRAAPINRHTSKAKYTFLLGGAMVLLLSGFSYVAFVKGTMLRQTPSIDKAISDAPFPVKLPMYMPVHRVNEWGQVSYYGSNSPSNTDISLVWAGSLANGKGASVTEDVALTNGGMIRLPKNQPIVHLASGKRAIFAERSGSLFWTAGNETYRLTLHPWDVMSVSELIKIADSVK